MYMHLQESHPGKEPEEVKFGMTVLRQHFTAFSRMVYEEILIFLAGDKTLNSKSMYNRCKIPRLSVMVGEEEVEPVKRTEYDTRELESEIAKLKTQQRQRREDSAENPKPNKRKRRWHFYYKWKRKRMEEDEVEEPQTNQENEESYSLKRPKTERGPNFTEEESPGQTLSPTPTQKWDLSYTLKLVFTTHHSPPPPSLNECLVNFVTLCDTL